MKFKQPVPDETDDAAAAGIRASLRVRRVAALLDMNERDVRELLDKGELEGHRIGTRGVRIYADSVAAYQERRAIAPQGRPEPVPARHQPTRLSAAHYKAVRDLEAAGILPKQRYPKPR